MIKHSIILAWRNYMRHKSSFFINLIGLSTGLACAILIFLWVSDELSINRFYENEDRLFQVMEYQEYSTGLSVTSSTPGLLAQGLKEDFPEIEFAATLFWPTDYTLTKEDDNVRAIGNYVGNDFFQIFSYPLLVGQPEQVMSDPLNIVISRKLAENLFGSVDKAVGESIEVDYQLVYKVSGVYENFPANSTLQFDFVTSYEHLLNYADWLKNWASNGPETVVLLKEGSDPEKVTEKIADYIDGKVEESNVELFLKSYADKYLYGKYENGKLAGGRIEYVRLFSAIAIFILLIACINFMNLSTARASRRAREVGVKKSMGIERTSLIGQFLTESVLLSLMALVLAIILVTFTIPQFNIITNKDIQLAFSFELFGSLALISLITGLVAGSYPALYLSSFNPVTVLKGEIRSSLGELWARKGLVVFQFSLSVILILAVAVVYKQIQYVNNQDIGFDKDQLVFFVADGKLEGEKTAFLSEAKRLDGVKNISSVAHDLVGQQNNTRGIYWQDKDPNFDVLFEDVRVNYDLLETIDVELVAGRGFSRQFGVDTNKILLNETAVKMMGLEDPIGKKVWFGDRQKPTEDEREVIGVVKDFHFQSLHQKVEPLFFRLEPEETWFIMASLERGKEKEGIANLKAFYEEFNTGFSLNPVFVDELYVQQYAAEQRVATLSRYFAGFAILISCLGLFGLAAFTADRKKKEIGIRKVLGATVSNIIVLLTKDFATVVLVAIVIGLPVAYFLVNNWLDRFAYKIELGAGFFLMAASMVLLIALLTVSTQALRSAQLNPKDCLRNE